MTGQTPELPPELPSELTAVLTRDPDALPPDLPRGSELPEDLDPFKDGILMNHQKEWLEDDSSLKVAVKGRRTGITFAEALDDTMIAAASVEAGGDNIFYIGDTKEKGREFIGYIAHFARIVCKELVAIEEFMFKDQQKDGSFKDIPAYRVMFAGGKRAEALSSRPANIRGLQGTVVIDEAAFHKNVREVIDAVNALLIWGGRVRVISTHYGVLNPFNELVREAMAGKNNFKVHNIPFSKAVENGLYKRVCLITHKTWSPEGERQWEADIRKSYGARTSAMAQELDCIPSEQEGAALTRVQIEACMIEAPIVRWNCTDEFKNLPGDKRKAMAREWFRDNVKPVIDRLDPFLAHVAGQDFARKSDLSALKVLSLGRDLIRRTALLIELRNVPFDQQREILFWLCDALPRFGGVALDASGNGAYLAEVAVQRYGVMAHEIKFTTEWYRLNAVPYIEAFADGTVMIPKDEDCLRDHQSLAYVNGICKVPDDARFKGADGLDRHGDTAIAGMLAYFASRQNVATFGYGSNEASDDEDDNGWGDSRDVRVTSGIGGRNGAYG